MTRTLPGMPNGIKPILMGTCTWYAFFVVCFALGGCDFEDPVGWGLGDWAVEPGTIIHYSDTSSVDLGADTVQVGERLHVSATTFGNGCTQGAGMRASTEHGRAVLTPLDSVYVPGPNEACTEQLKVMDHAAEVFFERAGAARVVIEGVRRGADVNGSEEVQLERTVIVE